MKIAGLTMLLFTSALVSQSLSQIPTDYPSYEPPADVKHGYTAEDLLGSNVRGKEGKMIGDVEDLIIGPDGQLRRLVVSANEGLFGTGGRRLAVDWGEVTVLKQGDDEINHITAPVTKANVEEYGLFDDQPKAVQGGKREWRAKELLGDYVSLKDIADYGSVTDLIFDRTGKLQAIAASPDRSGSLVFAHFSGERGWEPGDSYYVLPYTRSEIARVLPTEMGKSSAM